MAIHLSVLLLLALVFFFLFFSQVNQDVHLLIDDSFNGWLIYSQHKKTLSKLTHQNLEFIHILMKNDEERFILVADTGDGLLDVSDHCAFQPLLMSV